MARTKRKPAQPKKKEPEPEVYTFPGLHDSILTDLNNIIVPTPWYNSNIDAVGNRQYSTNVMGRFRCKNRCCLQKGWGSKKVSILITGYPNNGYNAQVFGQLCKSCEKLGALTLDEESYIKRVAYRLKKFAGVVMTPPPFHGTFRGPKHESDLCEGCKRGYCEQGDFVNGDMHDTDSCWDME